MQASLTRFGSVTSPSMKEIRSSSRFVGAFRSSIRKALSNAGLNPYMFQMANIREQVSWVHVNREKATRKALSLVAGAINRIKWHESLEKRSVIQNHGKYT